jgi:hypothetical protein
LSLHTQDEELIYRIESATSQGFPGGGEVLLDDDQPPRLAGR